MSALLGFIDGKVTPELENGVTFSTSKIGGLPILSDGSTFCAQCGQCSSPCRLVCQINCPVDEKYDRTIFVFCCQRADCQRRSDGWQAIRILVPSDQNDKRQVAEAKSPLFSVDDDWGVEDSNDWGSDSASQWDMSSTDAINPPADSLADPDDVTKKLTASLEKLNLLAKPVCKSTPAYDSYFIAVMEESDCIPPYTEDTLRQHLSPDNVEDMKSWWKNKPSSGASERYERSEVSHGDRTFYKFTKALAKSPQQLIRYEFGGSALPMASLDSSGIPRCYNCGASRAFEVQLMPALLQNLQLDGTRLSIDVGTVIIFTCTANCDKEKVTPEHMVIQHDADEQLCQKLMRR